MGHKDYQNIFVVKNRALGDSIMGLSTLQYIKELYPKAHLTYALPSWITKLYQNVGSSADEYYELELKGLLNWVNLWRELRKKKVDAIYEMHQSGRTAKFFKLYALIHRVPYFFHNHHLKSGTRVHDQGVIKSVIQRDLDGVFSQMSDKKTYPDFLNYCPQIKIENNKKDQNLVFIGVVATRRTKMWPLSSYAELTQKICEGNPDIRVKIPLSQSRDDLQIKADLRKIGLHPNVEIIHIPLEKLASYMSQGVLYIGNDTGLKHLAISVGVKSFTFFGPEPPSEWHPYDQKAHPYFYKEGLECRTRVHHYCGLSECESMICLNQFSPEEIYQQVRGSL